MILGLFVFSVQTAPFDSISRANSWRWPSNDRTGADQVYQYTGRDEETITLTGTLMPEYSGGPIHLEMLRMMANAGKPYLMMGGDGKIYGYYIITALNEDKSALMSNGEAQKIDFNMTLKRYTSITAGGMLSMLTALVKRWF